MTSKTAEQGGLIPPAETGGMASLQVRDENNKIVLWEDFGGADWEDDGTEEIQPSFPYIKMVQGSSQMDGAGKHGGDFWHSDSEGYTSEIVGVALVMRDTRALFRDGIEGPTCLSVDGVQPLPDQPEWGEANGPQPLKCADCPLSQWGEDNEKPACKASKVLLIDRGDGDLAQLRVSGKSIKPLRQFVARRCKPKRIPLYAFRLALTTRELAEMGKDGKPHKWHELVVAGDLMQPAEAMRYSDMLRLQREKFTESLKITTDTVSTEWPDDVPADPGWETA